MEWPSRHALWGRQGEKSIRTSKQAAVLSDVALAPVESQAPYISMIETQQRLRLIADAAERVNRSPKPDQQLLLVEGKEYSLIATIGGTKRGANRKGDASHLAAVACAAYEEYTGKRATITTDPETSKRRGNFVGFVTELFAAAGIKGKCSQLCQMGRGYKAQGVR